MKTTKMTSIIAMIALVSFSMPSVFAETPIEDYYWDDDADICYLETELNNLRYGGSTTDHADDIKENIGNAVAIYNGEMNGIELNDNDVCSGERIVFGAQNLAEWTYLAAVTGIGETNNILYLIAIDYNTDHIFHGDTDQCWPSYDTEWVANHELGHAIGLAHNTGWFADSVMVPSCATSWEDIQPGDDEDAIDEHYE